MLSLKNISKDYYIGKSGEFLGYTKEKAKNK